MPKYVIDFPDGSYQISAASYDNQADAEAWQALVEGRLQRTGLLLQLPTWEASAGAARLFDTAVELKRAELETEAQNRLPEDFASLKTLRAIIKANGNSNDPEVLYAKAVWNAGKQAFIDIGNLPNIAAVAAYNVATEPLWPTPP